jgi:hypothetical protein
VISRVRENLYDLGVEIRVSAVDKACQSKKSLHNEKNWVD